MHNGLLAARLVLEADVTVVAQGPGNLGTGTRWGFSGVAAGEAINAAATLGGRPVAALRVSEADQRAAPPRRLPPLVDGLRSGCGPSGRHRRSRARRVPSASRWPTQAQALAARTDSCPIERGRAREALSDSPVALSTMGRGMDADAAAFVASAAAGRHVAALLIAESTERSGTSLGSVHCRAGRSRRSASCRRAVTATGRPVGQRGRADQLAAPADLHAGDALLPALDQAAERERDRLAPAPGRVELLAGVELDPEVVHGDRRAGRGFGAIAERRRR